MKTLIIDDEEESHIVLKQHLNANHPEVEVLGSAYSKEEGVELIRQYEPELLFLDIEMPDGTGFDLLLEIQRNYLLNFQVVFVTAHNQYAQTAIRLGALDYLLKPVSAAEVTAATLKAQIKRLQHIQLTQMEIIQETLRKLDKQELPQRMSISTHKGILYFPTKDVIRLEAMQNFTEFKVEQEERRLIASFNLKKYETDLKPYKDFMRVHRSHIVNLPKVVRLKKGERYFLEMSDGAILPVSKKSVSELILRLGDLTV